MIFFHTGTNTESEDALDNASFLHKNSQITYEMMQQMQVSVTGKRQWQENCEMLPSPTLPPTTQNMIYANSGTNGARNKRQCLTVNGPGFTDTNSDNARNWMMDCPQDSFEFESISSCESSSQPSSNTTGNGAVVNKWNGDVPNHAPLHQQMTGVLHHHQGTTNVPHFEHHMSGSGTVNFDEDISQQVQNDLQSAIDNLLNLQESDSLPFSLDQTIGSFLVDNGLATASNNLTTHHNMHQQHASQQPHHQQHQQQLTKSKYVRNPINIEVPNHDIGGCLIGGNLDDSPTGNQLQVSHHNSNTNSGPTTPISANEYGSGLVDDTVKSIMTS